MAGTGKSPENRNAARAELVTVIEVAAAGQGQLPVRRRGRSPAAEPAEQLAALLSHLAGPGAEPISELGFRKAVEALNPATIAAQAADLACFAAFCKPGQRALPAEEADIVAYIDVLEQRGRKPATVRRRLASLSAAHGYLGLSSPMRGSIVLHALKGLRRRKGAAQRQAAGIRLDEDGSAGLTLAALLEACSTELQGLRDAALLSTGYDAGLRVSELTAVEVAHLAPHDDGTAVLFIPSSKTDQAGEGAFVWVSAESMRRIRAWLEASGIREGLLFRRVGVDRRNAVAALPERRLSDIAYNAKADFARLLPRDSSPALVRYTVGTDKLTRQGVNCIVRRVARAAADLGLVDLYGDELDAAIAAISSHSLRVGLTQDLFAAGEDAGPVAQALRWTNPATALRYARKLAPRSNAAARVLGKRRG